MTFRKRFSGDAEEADRPEAFIHVLDGVVLNAVKAETIDPPALHSQEVLDEDDNFESIGSETWEYEVADGREKEFVEALENSGMVLDYEPIDEVTP